MSRQQLGSDVDLTVMHTAHCERNALSAIRSMLDRAFGGDFSDDDWEHALGGLHVVARRAGAVIGHAALVQRRLLFGERALRAGYVEAVAVTPEWQRHGIGGAMMGMVERFILAAYDIGSLSATPASTRMYGERGWLRWRGPLNALTPAGIRPTPEEQGGVYVYPTGPIDVQAPLTCDWRNGDLW